MSAISVDHLVYGVPDLAAGVRAFHELTGIAPAPGGRHELQATANYLVGLGGSAYLEIIGPDPDSDMRPRWFGLARLQQARLLTWAVRTTDIDAQVAASRAAGYDPGDPAAMSRRTGTGGLLTWQLTPDTVEATGGVLPFLIDWGSTRHPTSGSLPELGLSSLTVLTPHIDETARQLTALDVTADVELAEEPGLRCVLDTPHGTVTLA